MSSHTSSGASRGYPALLTAAMVFGLRFVPPPPLLCSRSPRPSHLSVAVHVEVSDKNRRFLLICRRPGRERHVFKVYETRVAAVETVERWSELCFIHVPLLDCCRQELVEVNVPYGFSRWRKGQTRLSKEAVDCTENAGVPRKTLGSTCTKQRKCALASARDSGRILPRKGSRRSPCVDAMLSRQVLNGGRKKTFSPGGVAAPRSKTKFVTASTVWLVLSIYGVGNNLTKVVRNNSSRKARQ